ncbi:MAG: phosphoadenosine phosphosulfate reductase family protein [Ktedonobacterales bacterium]|nr:phosphoadenosine phosphosulfate reductase family protein [Ktedonobacterales bacterium]
MCSMPPARRARFLAHSRRAAFQRKLAAAETLVADILAHAHRPYIAFSSGKDSLVTAALVWRSDPTVPAVYFDADCAYPETTALIDATEASGKTIIRWPCEPILETMARCGGPTAPESDRATMRSTVYTPITQSIATYGFDAVFVGLRRDESRGRDWLVKARGTSFYHRRDGIIEVLPVAAWSYDDIWAYITSRELVYNGVYDKMWDLPEREQRVSYWAGETNHAFGRWVWLRREYPALYAQFVARFPEVGSYT